MKRATRPAAGMVLTRKVGRERPFAMVLLLYVVTFGVYGIYWHYKAHNEVYRQFELDRDNRDEGVVWLLLGAALRLAPLTWVFQYMYVDHVRLVRERLGFGKNLRPGAFLALVISASVASFIAVVLVYVALLTTPIAELSEDSTDAEAADAWGEALPLLLGALGLWVLGVVLNLVAFALLQSDLNGVWRAYDRRMSELVGTPPPAATGWTIV